MIFHKCCFSWLTDALGAGLRTVIVFGWFERIFTSKKQDRVTPRKRQKPVFINYRRSDSTEEVLRLHKALQDRYGDQFFIDVRTVQEGLWEEQIEGALLGAKIIISVIGNNWLTATQKRSGRRRIDIPGDWVRRELETAIRRRKLIIPLYIDEAEQLVAEDLPKEIARFVKYQSLRLRPGAVWATDLEVLCNALERKLPNRFERQQEVQYDKPKALVLSDYNQMILSQNRHDQRLQAKYKWVTSIVERLKLEGIDVEYNLDVANTSELHFNHRVYAIRRNEYVIVMCTPEYKRRFESVRSEPGFDACAFHAIKQKDYVMPNILPVVIDGHKKSSVPQSLYALDEIYAPIDKLDQCERAIQELKRLLLNPVAKDDFEITEYVDETQQAEGAESYADQSKTDDSMTTRLHVNQIDRLHQWNQYLNHKKHPFVSFLLRGSRYQSLRLFIDRLNADLAEATDTELKVVRITPPGGVRDWPQFSVEWIRLIAKTINMAGEHKPIQAIIEAHQKTDLHVVIGPIYIDKFDAKAPDNIKKAFIKFLDEGILSIIKEIRAQSKPSKHKLWWTLVLEYAESDPEHHVCSKTKPIHSALKGLSPAVLYEKLPPVRLPSWDMDVFPFLEKWDLSSAQIDKIKQEFEKLDGTTYSDLGEFLEFLQDELDKED